MPTRRFSTDGWLRPCCRQGQAEVCLSRRNYPSAPPYFSTASPSNTSRSLVSLALTTYLYPKRNPHLPPHPSPAHHTNDQYPLPQQNPHDGFVH